MFYLYAGGHPGAEHRAVGHELEHLGWMVHTARVYTCLHTVLKLARPSNHTAVQVAPPQYQYCTQ